MLVAALGIVSVANAESEISTSAEYRVRGALNQGETLTNDRSSNVLNHRMMLKTEYKASDRFSANLTLVHHADFGDRGTTFSGGPGNSTNNPNRATRDNLDDSSTGLIVNEAYATWRINDEFSLKMGRGSFEGADGSSTSTNDFQNALTAFDGVAGIYELEFARITGFLIKFAEGLPASANTNNDPEVNTVGISADLKFAPEIFSMMNVYTNQVRQDLSVLAGLDKEVYQRYGVVLGGQFAELVDFKLAFHGHTGEATDAAGDDNDIKGHMIDAQLGVTMEDMSNMNFYVGYHTDTGSDGSSSDDETYRAYYYDVHKFAGLMDVVGWGNLSYIHAGFSMDPMENLTVGLKYHMFTATEKEGTTTFLGAASGAAVDTSEDDIGSEIDLYAVHKYDGGFQIEARYGLFMTGERFGPEEEDFQQFFIQGTMSF